MKGGSQWGSNKTMVNSRNTSTLNTKLLILVWNCPCLAVLHHIPTNGQWPAALPNAGPHEPESFLLFWNCLLLGMSWSRSCMKVCKYACINVSKYLQGMYVHTYLRRHVHVCINVWSVCTYWCVITRDQITRLYKRLPGWFHRLSPSCLCRVDSYDDITYHIVYKINKQANR